MSRPRLYRLGAACPNPECRAVPRLRVTEDARQFELGDPERVVMTYQCHRCNRTYEIRARDFYWAA